MENKKLRIGIIGTGGIAFAHIEAYKDRAKNVGDIEIVAGCDIIPGKAEEFFKANGVDNVRCYTSHEEMLEKEHLDAVSVCTYNRQHAAPTICAMKHGVNVLLEKPFAVTLEECVEMMRVRKRDRKDPYHRIPAPLR